jgi:hypothetical protein
MANHSRRLDRLEERNRPNTRRVHLVIGDSRDGQEEQRREMIAGQAHENDLFIFRLIVSVMAEVLRPIVRWLCDKVTLRRRGWPSPQGRYCARCAGRARFQVPAVYLLPSRGNAWAWLRRGGKRSTVDRLPRSALGRDRHHLQKEGQLVAFSVGRGWSLVQRMRCVRGGHQMADTTIHGDDAKLAELAQKMSELVAEEKALSDDALIEAMSSFSNSTISTQPCSSSGQPH